MDEIKDTPTDRAALALILAGSSGPDAVSEGDNQIVLNMLWRKAARDYHRLGSAVVLAATKRVQASRTPPEVKERALDLLSASYDYILHPEVIRASEVQA